MALIRVDNTEFGYDEAGTGLPVVFVAICTKMSSGLCVETCVRLSRVEMTKRLSIPQPIHFRVLTSSSRRLGRSDHFGSIRSRARQGRRRVGMVDDSAFNCLSFSVYTVERSSTTLSSATRFAGTARWQAFSAPLRALSFWSARRHSRR